jgi:hypothetical protein
MRLIYTDIAVGDDLSEAVVKKHIVKALAGVSALCRTMTITGAFNDGQGFIVANDSIT